MPFSRRPANQRDKHRARKSSRRKHSGGLRRDLLPEFLESRHLMAAFTWNVIGGGTQSWDNNANWNPNTGFPNAISDVANLNINNTGNLTVNLNVPITVGNMTVGDTSGGQTQTIAVGTAGNLTFDNSGSGVQLVMPNTSTGTFSISAPIVLNDNLTIVNNSTSLITISGSIITNGHTITINGSGPVTLSGSQTLTGNTTYTTTSSALVTIGAGIITTNDSNLTFNLNGTGNLTVTSPIVLGNSTVSFARLGNGTLVSSGALTVNGNVAVVDTSALSRTLGAITNNGFGIQVSGNTPLTLGTITLNGNQTITNNISVGNLTLGAITGNFSTTLNGSGNTTAQGIIGPAGGLGVTVNALGITTFSGANTFDGPFQANAGSTVVSSAATALGSSNSTTTIANGATLDLRANSVANRSLLISGSGVLGMGALVNNGTASTWLGNVTFAGDTIISPNTGALTISGNMSVGGNITDNGNSALSMSGGIVLTRDVALTSNSPALFTIGGASGINAANNDLTFNLNSTGNVTISGGLTLGNNTVTFNRPGNGTLTTTSGATTAGNVTYVNNTGLLRTLGTIFHNGDTITTLGNGPMTLGAITLNRDLTLVTNLPGNLTLGTVTGPFNLTLNGTGNIAAGGVIGPAGAGGVTVNATGNTAFTAANTFNGPFQASAGATVIVTNTASLGGNNSTAVFANGSTLDLRVATFGGRSVSVSGNGVQNQGAIVNNLAANTTLSAMVRYNGDTLVRANAGNITLSGFQWRDGNLTTDGNFNVTVSGIGNLSKSSTLRHIGNGILTVSGAIDTLSRTLTLAQSGAGNMNVSAPLTLEFATVIFERDGTGNLSTTGTATLNGDVTYINNTGILRVIGAQTVVGAFTHNLTFNGNGPITTGAFAALPANLNVTNNLGLSNLLTLGTIANTGNNLNFGGNGSTTLGTITVTNSNQVITNNSTGLLTLGAVTQGTFNTTLNGSGDIFAGGVIGASTGLVTVNATGNTTFAATNTFTGSFVANAGRIIVTANNGLGSNGNTATFAPGATLDLRANVPAGRALSIGGLGIDGLGALVSNGIGNAGWGGTVTFNASTIIAGNNTGNLSLTGAITTSGRTITNNYTGPLRLVGAFNLLDDQSFVQNSGSPLTIGAVANQGKNITFSGNGTGNIAVGAITLSIGPQVITAAGSSRLTLAAITSTLFDTTLAGNQPITGSGIISGNPASLTLTNTAGVTLTAANTYTGPTNVQNGSNLLLTGSIGPSSTVFVQNNALLFGNGTIAGNLSVAAGGNFSPGINAPGQFVASRNGAANVVFAQGSTFNVQLNGVTPITEYDVLNLSGAAGSIILGNSTLNVTKDPGFVPTTGDRFFIVRSANNTVLPGQFIGLGNGTQFFIDNVNVKIFYTGNVATGNLTGGNDVVIEVQPPVLNINDVVVIEGNSGMVDAVFTVTMSRPLGTEATVIYATADNTAADIIDFLGQTGTLTFSPGDTVKTVTISVLGDTLNEANEVFHLNLSSPGNATIQDGQGNGTITNDDPMSTLNISDAAIAEGNTSTTNAVFTVNLTPVAGQVITVEYTTANVSATSADLDYVPTSGTLTFAPGVTSQVVFVAVNGDFNFEGDETFQVILSNPNAALLGVTTGIGTISNDDPIPTVSIGNTSVVEGNSSTIDAVFSLTLSNPNSQQITVVYNTGNLTATTGDLDYQPTSGTVTFAPGVTTQTVTVLVNGDTQFEADERFDVTLSSPTNVNLGFLAGNATIVNDDLQPTITIGDRILAEGNSSTTNILFNVSLSNSSYQPITVVFNTVDGNATVADGDFQFTSGTITFAPGTTSQNITVLVTGETRYELDESFQVNLSSPGNATIVDNIGNATITNDDAVPSLAINSISVTEGTSSSSVAAVFTVTLTPVSGQPATVVYSTSDGNATVPDLDYVGTSGTLTFAAGETTHTITVIVNGDAKFEPNETFRVTLSSPVNATIGAAVGNATILNDDVTPTISIGNFSIVEGNVGFAGGLFPVTLSNPSSVPVTVVYGTSDGTALLSDSDYPATSGTLTFSPGTTSQNITLRVNGDTKFEANERFNVNLSSSGNATIGVPTASVTIVNDDPAPTLTISDVTVLETNATTVNAVFTVTMSAVNGLPVIVEYSTANVNALAPADYTAASGTLTFLLGETSKTITIAVQPDLLNEANETFQVNLSNAVNATLLDAQGVGTITNDDNLPSLAIDSVTVNEGNSGTVTAVFTVTLTPVSGQVVTVAYLTANVTAEVGDNDYQATSGTLTFSQGVTVQQITVVVNGDTKYEIDELFQVNLSNPVNSLISTGTGNGSIPNTDPVPQINITQRTQDEGTGGNSNFLFNVSLTNASYQPITVVYTTSDGTATVADADYTATSGTLTFTPGTSSRNITVVVNADAKLENHEAFQVSLSSPGNASINASSAQGSIINDDAQPLIRVNDITISEGNSGPTQAVFSITLSNPSIQPISVSYATDDGTALLSDIDYTATSGSVTFAPGVTSQNVTVLLSGDTTYELDETFKVVLSNAGNGSIAVPIGTGTIRNDDAAPAVNISDVTLTEGDSGTQNAVFTITLTGPRAEKATVAFTTADSSTTADDDYLAKSGTLTFELGVNTQTVTVAIVGDRATETDESFQVNLSDPVNAALADGIGVGNILNNDNYFWHNPIIPTDVNGDGFTSSIDLVLVVEALNTVGAGFLDDFPIPPIARVDVNRDDNLSAFDLLLLVAALNEDPPSLQFAPSALQMAPLSAGMDAPQSETSSIAFAVALQAPTSSSNSITTLGAVTTPSDPAWPSSIPESSLTDSAFADYDAEMGELQTLEADASPSRTALEEVLIDWSDEI